MRRCGARLARGQLIIIDANDINSDGNISGQAFDPSTGEMPAIELIPCEHSWKLDCGSAARASAQVTLPENVRDELKGKRLRFRK